MMIEKSSLLEIIVDQAFTTFSRFPSRKLTAADIGREAILLKASSQTYVEQVRLNGGPWRSRTTAIIVKLF